VIDIFVIATDGYISNEQKAFSVAVNGYYPSDVLVVIPVPVPPSTSRPQSIGGSSAAGHGHRQEDEDLLLIIKTFLDIWL